EIVEELPEADAGDCEPATFHSQAPVSKSPATFHSQAPVSKSPATFHSQAPVIRSAPYHNPENMRSLALAGFKKDWAELNAEFQRLPLVIQGPRMTARKGYLERQLTLIEENIRKLNEKR
ncbi:MAG: hypothetical protein SGCHY_002312, partial [Lobulomycetales sp.]